MAIEKREGTIGSAVADAWKEITAIGDELQLWYDGMSDKRQESEEGIELYGVIDAFESGPYEPDVLPHIRGESLVYNAVTYAQMSLAARFINCKEMVDAAIDKCEEIRQGKSVSEQVEIVELITHLEQARKVWDEIEIPRRDH